MQSALSLKINFTSVQFGLSNEQNTLVKALTLIKFIYSTTLIEHFTQYQYTIKSTCTFNSEHF